MALIRTLENKIKVALIVAIGSFVFSVGIIICVLVFSYNLVLNERKNVYVLDNGIPVLVQRTSIEDNEEVEMKSHINMFHMLFFNLPPDDKYIKSNIEQAMYLIDQSGAKQYADLREQGFYNQILANSMHLTIKSDSIDLDYSDASGNVKFTYYGTQRIERQTTIVKRRLVTTGFLKRKRGTRTENNPHGFMIMDWKTILNEDIDEKIKKSM